MHLIRLIASLTLCSSVLALSVANHSYVNSTAGASSGEIYYESEGKPQAIFHPRVFIISSYGYEAQSWRRWIKFDVSITIPGLSPRYPAVHCTSDYQICQLVTGRGSVNAAASVTALGLSPLFDLYRTYFLVSGIAGGEPEYTTLGSVIFAKYSVQVSVEYEVAYQDFHSTNPRWKSGYWPLGTKNPWEYPREVYGTEVFEVNEALRDRAAYLAGKAHLNEGSDANAKERKLYQLPAARNPPSIKRCDIISSDTYFVGNTLSDYFASYSSLVTNNQATFCAVDPEDNGSLEALIRLHRYGLVNFNRVVLSRGIAGFTRPPPSKSGDTVGWFNYAKNEGAAVAVYNLPVAGLPFVKDVVNNWHSVYWSGKKYRPVNYTGDILGAIGGSPGFGKPWFHI